MTDERAHVARMSRAYSHETWDLYEQLDHSLDPAGASEQRTAGSLAAYSRSAAKDSTRFAGLALVSGQQPARSRACSPAVGS